MHRLYLSFRISNRDRTSLVLAILVAVDDYIIAAKDFFSGSGYMCIRTAHLDVQRILTMVASQ